MLLSQQAYNRKTTLNDYLRHIATLIPHTSNARISTHAIGRHINSKWRTLHMHMWHDETSVDNSRIDCSLASRKKEERKKKGAVKEHGEWPLASCRLYH